MTPWLLIKMVRKGYITIKHLTQPRNWAVRSGYVINCYQRLQVRDREQAPLLEVFHELLLFKIWHAKELSIGRWETEDRNPSVVVTYGFWELSILTIFAPNTILSSKCIYLTKVIGYCGRRSLPLPSKLGYRLKRSNKLRALRKISAFPDLIIEQEMTMLFCQN